MNFKKIVKFFLLVTKIILWIEINSISIFHNKILYFKNSAKAFFFKFLLKIYNMLFHSKFMYFF
jgi:hypothetical protein